MDTPLAPVRFQHGDSDVVIHVQDACSVSRFISDRATFYEAPFLDLLASALPSTGAVVDVGAHIGNHTVYFGAVLGRRVLAFEPNPASREVLQRNIEANGLSGRVTVVPAAAGAALGSADLAPQSGDDAGTMSLVGAAEGGGLAVEVTTLDAAWAELGEQLGTDGVALLKIDVEGFEIDVLRGAVELLATHAPIVTTEIQSLAEFGALHDLLAEQGYRPVAVANPTPTVIWWPDSHPTPPPDSLTRASFEYAIASASTANERSLALRKLTASPQPSGSAPATPHTLLIAKNDRDELGRSLSRELGRVSVLTVGRGATEARYRWQTYAAGQQPEACRTFAQPHAASELELLDHVATARPTMLVVEHDPDLVVVVRRLAAMLEVPYVVVFTSADISTGWRMWPFFNGARMRLLAPGIDRAAWRSRLIMDAVPLVDDSAAELAGHLRRAATNDRATPRPASSTEPRLRMLLVSYYMPPCESVAMHRLAYWHDTLPSLAAARGDNLEVDVVTATESPDNDARYHVVIDRELAHPTGRAAEGRLRRLQQTHLNHIGATWSPYVEDWLRKRAPYDVAVVSGNPFHYFEIASALTAAGTRVILDFRDPFAGNPRFVYNDEQQQLVTLLEQGFVADADAVVSVNQTCLDLIASAPEGRPQRREILPNGFDERILAVQPDPSARDHRTTFVYAGTFYADRDPARFVAQLPASTHALLHVGRVGFEEPVLTASAAAKQVGLRPYDEVIAILKAGDAGLILTVGDPFEQTTKVFDYIAADIDIVIVTDGEPRTGELHTVTAELEGVYWVRNTAEDIDRFLRSYTPVRRQRPQRDTFSRLAQADRLLTLAFPTAEQEPA